MNDRCTPHVEAGARNRSLGIFSSLTDALSALRTRAQLGTGGQEPCPDRHSPRAVGATGPRGAAVRCDACAPEEHSCYLEKHRGGLTTRAGGGRADVTRKAHLTQTLRKEPDPWTSRGHGARGGRGSVGQ